MRHHYLKKKYDSVHQLHSDINYLIDNNKLDLALNKISEHVSNIITEPLCTSTTLGSKELDHLCLRIGSLAFNETKKICSAANKVVLSEQPTYVYLVTKMQVSGGHSRVIRDLINCAETGVHYILSTELSGRTEVKSLHCFQEKGRKVIFESSSEGSFLKKLKWLQMRLLELRPQKVYLFNHHQDSVAVAAIQPEMNFNAYFYHHGDHHLCLGLYCSHLKHIDPHPMGFFNCRDKLGINNIYLPLSIEDQGIQNKKKFMSQGYLVTCTAARSNKVEIPYYVNYIDTIPQLIKATGGKHVHIGKISFLAVMKIRFNLKRLNLPEDRFLYIKYTSSVWKTLQKNNVDLYIASFPYGGGLTLIEAMGAGIPVVLHQHMYSRILSGLELSYENSFSWRYPEELLDYCSRVSIEELELNAALSRNHYEQFHIMKHTIDFVNNNNYIEPRPRALDEKYTPVEAEVSFWVARQINISSVLYRIAYRLAKKIKSILNI